MEHEPSNIHKKRNFEELNDALVLCGHLKRIISQTLTAKQSAANNGAIISSDLEESLVASQGLFLDLKQANRELQLELETRKNESQKQKNTLDDLNKHIQSLIFEKSHLKAEIERCKQYNATRKDLSIVSEEEFTSRAPTELKNYNNDHEKMLARLRFELMERERLGKDLDNLNEKRKSLNDQINSRNNTLEDVNTRVKTLYKATERIQQQLNINMTHQLRQHTLAHKLPTPLYTVYFQAEHYFESNPNGAVKSVIIVEKNDNSKVSPFYIDIHFHIEGRDFHMWFYHVLEANLISVLVQGMSQAQEKGLLPNLFSSADSGKSSANPYHFNSEHYKNARRAISGGKIYKWAQWLAGFDFLPKVPQNLSTEPSESDESLLSRYSFVQFVEKLTARIQNRAMLTSELTSLIKLHVNESAVSHYQQTTHAQIPKGVSIVTWREIGDGPKKDKNSNTNESNNTTTDGDDQDGSFYFKATFQAQNKEYQAFFEVRPEYPAAGSSIVALSTTDESATERLKIIENEINHRVSPNIATQYLLSVQILRLQSLLSVDV